MVSPFRSLRFTLLVPFVGLVVAVAAAVTWLSYQASVRAVDEVSRRLLEDVANRIAQTTTQYLSTPAVVLNVIAPESQPDVSGADLSSLSPVLVSDFEKRLWVASNLFPKQNHYVYYGADSGRFVGLQRDAPGGAELRLRAQPDEPRRVYRAVSPEVRGEVLREEAYDPKTRPWYKLVVEKRVTTWTPMYRNFASGELTITLARPVFRPDGTVRGVAATDLSLAQLAKFVRALTISESGVAFIVDPAGQLIASSFAESAAGQTSQTQTSGALDSASPLIRDAFATIVAARNPDTPLTSNSTTVRHQPFKSSLGPAHLSVIDYHDGAGLDWRLVVAVPRADHMAPVYQNMTENLTIGALAVLLALALGAWMIHRVARDVSDVSRAADRLMRGDGPITRIPTRGDEIGVLATSVAAIQDQLLYDPLTGALNRSAFVRQFGVVVDELAAGERLALVYIDLDRFKKVNDRHGHAMGDIVLAKSAERIRRRLREKDLFARYGGDEFVVMVRGKAAVDAAPALADRLRERLSMGMTIGELSVSVGASIGIAIYPDDGDSLDELLARADSRMYDEKRKTASERKDRRRNFFVSAP